MPCQDTALYIPSISHIRLGIQSKNFEILNIVLCRLFYLYVFGTETISSDGGSIDISDTF